MRGQSNSNRRRSRRNNSAIANLMIGLAVVVVCVVIGFATSNLRTQSRQLAETQVALEQQIAIANQQRETLLAQEQYMKTNQYVEDVAKERLGMVYPNEIVIRPQE